MASYLSFLVASYSLTLIILNYTGLDAGVPFAMVGPVCSVATDLIATIVSRYTSTVQVSYGVVSPVFSDVSTYSFFYSTVPAYTEYVKPIAAILEYFDWQVIGLVVDTDLTRFTLSSEALVEFLSKRGTNFTVSASLSLVSHFRLEGRNLLNAIRIYIVMAEEKNAADTLCAAFKSRMTGSEFVWILLGDYIEGWWRSVDVLDCTEEEMLSAIESTIILTNSVQISHNTFNSIRQQNQSEFWEEFRTYLKENTGLEFEEARALRVLHSYDAVWSIANALNATLAEEPNIQNINSTSTPNNRFPYKSTREVERLHIVLNQNMKELVFQGTSGEIKFTNESNSPQSPITSIFQMQNGTIVPVGIHKMADRNVSALDFTFFGNNLSWQGEGPPRDRPVVVFQVVEMWIIVIMLILTALGIAYAMVILIVNCVYRKHKVIKASSPYINILIIIGCILGLLLIPVLSIENLDTDHVLPETVYSIFCNIRPWMIDMSLTLAFGALFTKTWRIYLIFRNPWAKARPYKDHILLLIVGVLLLVDVVVLSVVMWRTPIRLVLFTFPSSTQQFTRNGYRICLEGGDLLNPNKEFLAYVVIVIIMKLVLFLFGIFLVIQTRKIKAKYFKDSRFIGMAVYGTVIACGVGFPLSLGIMIFLQEDVGFVVASATILFCSFFILSAVFLPRFALLRKYKKRVPTVVLLELNPSFRVRKQPYRQTVQLERRRHINRDSQNTEVSEMDSMLSSPNPTMNTFSPIPKNGNDNLFGDSGDKVCDWEPAYDSEEDPTSPTHVSPNDDNKAEVS